MLVARCPQLDKKSGSDRVLLDGVDGTAGDKGKTAL
ncbi:hypothetical protein SAMN05216243_1032 [Sediminibacillus albus]|uniref:Uncharacterized protein n=1 Tax=Sediminibacillus albus TaxID=407036 RepID=A0A1G8WYB2_9BACI|nr:hypothetical protein SAMN05216243_1032 [Sediminibacillus albus]